MRLLITGAFGNISKAVIEEAYKRHHEITVFDAEKFQFSILLSKRLLCALFAFHAVNQP